VPVSNGYGSTEAGTVMHVPLDRATMLAKVGSCGLPAPAVEVRLVAADGAEAAAGEVGEVWLRGGAITPGYWRQPEATAAAFQDGWFRTGDAARRDEDGFYTLIDRWKDMYISGGENVYPAEVEAALLEIEGVAEAAVVGVSHERWGEAGVAYLVRKPASPLEEAAVLSFCRVRLAGYKRPVMVRFVDSLPRNAAGKVRKQLLRAEHAQ
jgi:fatty-acyl-CoA synthase